MLSIPLVVYDNSRKGILKILPSILLYFWPTATSGAVTKSPFSEYTERDLESENSKIRVTLAYVAK